MSASGRASCCFLCHEDANCEGVLNYLCMQVAALRRVDSIIEVTIYLDNAATTHMSDAALDEYTKVQRNYFGNPNGVHHVSQAAKTILEEKREYYAKLVGADVRGTIFTSSGTEACNLAIKGGKKDELAAIVSGLEHHCVLEPAKTYPVVKIVKSNLDGTIDLNDLEKILKENGSEVGLFALMAVNNETGVIQPIEEATQLVREHAGRAKILVDAVQGAPWLDLAHLFSFSDMMAVSAHKFHGPKGVGVLFSRSPNDLSSIISGGGQEYEKRSGTQDVASIAASAIALEEVQKDKESRLRAVKNLNTAFLDSLARGDAEFMVNGSRELQLGTIVNICFPEVRNEELIFLADQEGIAVSAGAACASGALQPSHVLLSMGLTKTRATSSIRVSFGVENTLQECISAAQQISAIAAKLRKTRAG